MKEKEKKNTIVKRMIFAVAAGFVVGFLMLFLREFLLESGNFSGAAASKETEKEGCK